MAGQRTMSSQNGVDLTGQNVPLPAILTGHAYYPTTRISEIQLLLFKWLLVINSITVT